MRHRRLIAGRLCWALLPACCGTMAAAAGPATPQPSFDIEAYDVDGARLLQPVEIETAVYPFLGPGRTADDVEHARGALEKVYHDRGYQSVVVEVPAQNPGEIIRLHVVEAPVGRLRVVGSRYFSPEVIRRQTPSLKEGEVPDFNHTQKELAETNRLSDRRVTPVLRAGVAPGTVDVDLKVSDTLPLHASLELTNDHSQDTRPLRLVASAHYDNLWQLGHSVSFTYSVAPQRPSDSQIFAGSYLAPLWGTPWSLLAYGYDSNSDVATLGGTNVLGKGYAVGVRGILQLPQLVEFSQSLSFGADFKHFDENISLGGPGFADTVVYVPLNAVYSLQRAGARSSQRASLGVTAGIRGLGSDIAAFQFKRGDANPNFIHLNLDAALTQALGHGVEAAERFSGQLADQPLIPSEEFAAGGLASVRGYLQSEAIGDSGFSGSFELRSPALAPRLGRLADHFVEDLRVYGFLDGAFLRVIDPLPEQTDVFALYSAGLGVRFQVLKYLKGDVVLAVPLADGAVTRMGRPRAVFSLKSEF